MSSRYSQPARLSGFHVAFGWDNPLGTFFFQVFKVTDYGDELIVWLGDRPRSIASIHDMAHAVAVWFDLSQEWRDRLCADRLADIDRGPTALQRLCRDLGDCSGGGNG